jgi:hypothetical protein
MSKGESKTLETSRITATSEDSRMEVGRNWNGFHSWIISYPSWIRNEDIPSIHSSPNETTLDIAGPITRSRAKQLEKEIHSQVNANLMFNNQITLNEPMLLSTCFNVLRNDGVHEQAWDDDDFCPPNICKEPGRA